MQGCECVVLMRSFLIKDVFCLSSRKFFISYLAAPRPTLSHWRGSSFTLQILVASFLVQPGSHWEPVNKVQSLRPAKGICGIWTGSIPCLSARRFPTVPAKLCLRQPILICSTDHLLYTPANRNTEKRNFFWINEYSN